MPFNQNKETINVWIFKKNQVEKEVPVFGLAGGEIVPITQVNDPVSQGR